MANTILLVDDEVDLLRALEFSFKKEGFHVRVARNGKEALAQAAVTPLPDLVLLDLMLPDIPGTEVCRRLKAAPETSRIPVVMLTAKGEEIDRVVGFEVGADDYVVKPFSTRELLLRVRAVLRRVDPTPSTEAAVRFGRLRLDPAAHRAWVDDEDVVLTALEFRLLIVLMDRRGRVQTRERLLEDVWDVHAAAYIETIRGVGYRFAATPEDVPA